MQVPVEVSQLRPAEHTALEVQPQAAPRVAVAG
jgi:hypothetical protein